METLNRLDTITEFSSLSVYRNARSMSASKTTNFDFKTNMEQTVVQITQEVVRGLVGIDDPEIRRQFDAVYKVVVTVYEKYRPQFDHLTRELNSTDMETTLQSFSGVLDKLFFDGHINYGRVASVLAFAGCLVHHCIRKEIISSSDVDQISQAIGRQLARRLINNQHSLVRICYYYF